VSIFTQKNFNTINPTQIADSTKKFRSKFSHAFCKLDHFSAKVNILYNNEMIYRKNSETIYTQKSLIQSTQPKQLIPLRNLGVNLGMLFVSKTILVQR
jgi:hypothetical protein